MQKLIFGSKVYNKEGKEIPVKNLVSQSNKTAFIIVFNRNQSTKHACKVWSAKLEKHSKKGLKVYKILAFKNNMDELFKHSFENAINGFCCDFDEAEILAMYGNCSKKIYNAAKCANDDTVAVAVFGEDKNLVFMHSEHYSEAAVKKLESAI